MPTDEEVHVIMHTNVIPLLMAMHAEHTYLHVPGIWEHVQGIKLGFAGIQLCKIGRSEDLMLCPVTLPLLLYAGKGIGRGH